MNIWSLPRETRIGHKTWHHRTDYRDILKVVKILSGKEVTLFDWFCAASYFYLDPIEDREMGLLEGLLEYMADFLNCGQPEPHCLCFGLIDWEMDAQEILEGVNAAAGIDIREKEHLHWWTFVSLFHCIRRGRLSDLVAIRWKRHTGKPLTEEEKTYLRHHPEKFRPQETEADKQKRKTLEALLA